jgi:hypothetical protein
VYIALNDDFHADWDLVLDFLGQHTDKIEYYVAWTSGDPSFLPGPSPAQSPPLASAQVLNLHKEIALRARISSKSVSIDSFIFPSLANTIDWCMHRLPRDVDKSWICLDVPSLLHGIGQEFSSN